MKRAVITGIGVVAGNAKGKMKFFEACSNGTVGIKECTAFKTDGLLTKYFGECDLSENNRLYELIRLAAEEMLTDAKVSTEYISEIGCRCRLCIGTLLAPMYVSYKNIEEKSEKNLECCRLAEMNEYI